ncbi:MAG: hypothetical protein AB8G16_10230 [Gammaproteobacteria bacterium]
MTGRAATTRYLDRYAEPQSQAPWPFAAQRFDVAIVVPAYDERRTFIDDALEHDAAASFVLIVVVNTRRDCAAEAIQRTTDLLNVVPGPEFRPCATDIGRAWLDDDGRRGLWLIDCVERFEPDDGVGLARKIGLDVALAHFHTGNVRRSLILCTDADASLPPGYCQQQLPPEVSALTFGFRHVGVGALEHAQLVYDQRLRDYPRELARAGSPYGFQALGSAMAVSASHYAQAGGCPRRQAGEDFHLLAKLAKLGRVEHRGEVEIRLRARESERVPFGTGPGVLKLSQHNDPFAVAFFINARSFEFLSWLLKQLKLAVEDARDDAATRLNIALREHMRTVGLLSNADDVVGLEAMSHAVDRARAASPDAMRRVQHIMTWFDALKTLRLLHRLRDAGWADVSFHDLKEHEPARLARGSAAT